ncbi:MAG: hypothetical protein BWY45_03514 [Euryarchaeota archaeon ADurb.Bin294]|nr:MAG: hypothetical protein BWY45_03514 [Euryarchaeota archaeon ADurb.Bin294]
MLVCKPFPGPADTGLDFIKDQEDVLFITDLPDFPEIALRWDDNPGFSLDRFNHHCCDIFGNCLADDICITIGNKGAAGI